MGPAAQANTNAQQSNKALSAAMHSAWDGGTHVSPTGRGEPGRTPTRCIPGCSGAELKLADSLFLPKEVGGQNLITEERVWLLSWQINRK